MGKMSEMETIIRELRDTASSLSDIANWLYEKFSSNQSKDDSPAEPLEKPITLEEVRAVCAEKSRAGFTAEVKAIITKHGADKLSAVDPSKYAELLAEVEVLGNAE